MPALSAFVSENKFVPGIMDEAIGESRERVTGNVDEILARLFPPLVINELALLPRTVSTARKYDNWM